jgi:ATP-dependent protease ClpP protease subunit
MKLAHIAAAFLAILPLNASAKPVPIVPHISLSATIDSDIADQFEAIFDIIDSNKAVSAVLVEINSPGGSVDDGFRIAKRIENAKVPVFCVVDGLAASMAFFILQSCDFRYMTDRSVLMAHEPSTAALLRGQQDDWRTIGKNLADSLKAFSQAMARHITKRLNISYEQFLNLISHGKELWLDKEGSLEIGAVDGAVQSVEDTKEIIKEVLE